MEIQVKKKDILWGYLGTITSMCANLIVIPFVLLYLDEEQIGLYYIFVALSSISQLFDFGFAPSIARNIAYIWTGANELKASGVAAAVQKEPNYKLLTHVMSVCKKIYLALGTAALILGSTAGTYYIAAVTNEFEGYSHFIAWGIYVIAIVLNIVFGYYTVLLRGIGHVEGTNKAMVISRGLQFLLSVVLLFGGFKLIGIAAAYLLYGMVYRLLARKYFFTYKENKERLKQIQRDNTEYKIRDTLKVLWPNTWREGLITVSEYLLNQATTVVASLFLPLYETGIFSFSMQIVTAIAMVSMAIFTTYQPTLQSAYAAKNKEVLKKNMSIGLFSYVAVYGMGMVCLLTVGRPVLVWIKPSFKVESGVFIMAGLYQFILKYRNCCTSYISATNRLIYTRSFIVSAFICIGFSVLFTKTMAWGIYGLLSAQIFSQLIYNAWYWPVFVHRELKLAVGDVVKQGYGGLRDIVLGRFRQS